MKKTLLFLLLTLLSCTTLCAYTAKIDGIYYNFSGDNATVTYLYDSSNNSSAYSGDVVIPNSVTYNGKTYIVTSIGERAFYSCYSLKSVTIPNSVTSIGYEAFRGCTSLTSITIPNSVTSIGSNAFYYCTSLTSITIPNSVTSIGSDAFYYCTSLTKVIVPDISAWCAISFRDSGSNPLLYAKHIFSDDGTEITDLTIPDGVTSIGYYAFYNCIGLKSVTIPNSVTSIGSSAFSDCTSLTSITIPNSVTSIGGSAFSYCTSLTSITIPNSVTSIGNFVFDSCEALTTVNIPEGVTRIGIQAFHGCISLTSFTIPESVTMIASFAFRGCDGLTSITIPENVTTIEYNAFSGCYFTRDSFINKSQLTDNSNWGAILCDEETDEGLLLKDNSVVKCRYWATSVNIPDNVKSIGEGAFSNCSNLTSIIIPESVTKIDEYAFGGCSNLKTIIFNDGKNKLHLDVKYKYHYYTPKWFDDCPLDSIYIGRNLDCSFVATDYNQTFTYPPFKNKSTLRSVEFGENVTEIPFDYFFGCTSLSSINIGRGVKKIGKEAFWDCQNLKKIVIPNNVEEIGGYAFSWLNLSSLIIEDGEKNIKMTDYWTAEESIFAGNTIDTVYLGRNGAVMKYSKIKQLTLGEMKIFEGLGYNYAYGGVGCDTINVLNIKEASDTLFFSVNERINNYRSYYVMPFNNIHIDSIYCNRIIGVYDQYNVSNKHPFDGAVSLAKLELGRELTSINDGMFYGCRISSLFIPNTVKDIASTSFNMCSDLSSVQIEDGPDILYFGKGDNFYGCPLKSVYLGRNMTYNTNSPFNRNKEGITSLTFGNNVSVIPDKAFSGLENLTELTLTTGLRKIGKMAFYGCEGLTSLSIPGNVTEIGQQAFDLCRKLKKLTLEDSSEVITFTAESNIINNAFTNSPLKDIYIGRNFNYSNVSPFLAIDSLQNLTLSNDVTYLKTRAFAGCHGLREVYCYAEETPNITSDTFGGIEVSKVLLVVPDDAHEKYKAHPIWKQFWIETPTNNCSSFTGKEKLTDIYNFSGQRLPNPQRGINIINGQKVLIK